MNVTSIFELLPGWLWALLLAGAVAISGVMQLRVGHAREDAAAARAELAGDRTRYAQAALEAEAANSRTALNRANQAMEATNAARQREIALRADADGALAELGRLRLAAATRAARRCDVSGQPEPAAHQPADPLGELLGACAAELQEVARDADAHAGDVRTLIDAWPK